MEPNIYSIVILDLNAKIKNYIMKLDKEGQIDRDQSNMPYVFSITSGENNTTVVNFYRNGNKEYAIINTRKRIVQPIISFNEEDGFKRLDTISDIKTNEPEQQERSRRELYNAITA